MRWWRDPRSRLVWLSVALLVVAVAIPALPGGLDYPRGAGELVFWIVLDGVLIALLANGSRLAAAVLLVLNVGFLLSVTVVASADELVRGDLIAFVVVVVAQSAVLVRLLFWPRAGSAALRA